MTTSNGKMTMNTSTVKGPVALKNVAAFMVMTDRLINRDAHLPGIGVCHGHSGLGKTYCSIFAGNRTRAVRVEVGDSWTRRSFLLNILHELGERPNRRSSVAELASSVIEALGNDPELPLIVDEADKLVDKGMIEIVRELHEASGAPVILIGEERLPTKLLAVERVHNRVLDWMPAQPCDDEDTQLLAAAFAPNVEIAPDLLDMIRSQSGGRARRIVVNIARVGEFARNHRHKVVDAARWGKQALFTGEPPAARSVELFKRVRAA
jgi:DNA transposition AAA+ family ATPase